MNEGRTCNSCGFFLRTSESECPFCAKLGVAKPVVAEVSNELPRVVCDVEFVQCPVCGTEEGFEGTYCNRCCLVVGNSRPIPAELIAKPSEVLSIDSNSDFKPFVIWVGATLGLVLCAGFDSGLYVKWLLVYLPLSIAVWVYDPVSKLVLSLIHI